MARMSDTPLWDRYARFPTMEEKKAALRADWYRGDLFGSVVVRWRERDDYIKRFALREGRAFRRKRQSGRILGEF